MLRTLLACFVVTGISLHVPKPPLLTHGSQGSRSGVRLASPLSSPEGQPLRPPSKLSGVVDDRVAALDRTPSFVEGIMISDVVTIGDTSDAPVIIGEELVAETAQESDNIAIAALLAVAVLWGTNFPAVRYLVTDPVSLTPAAYSFARFGASALALSPLLPRASSKGALLAGAECGLWIAAGYVVQCLALQGTTAAKGALLAALQVVVVPAVVVLFPALRPKAGKQPTMKDWVCAGAALAGVALLELQGLTAPVASDAVAALQPVFFGISYLRIAEAGRRYPSDDDALAMAAAQVVAVAAVASVWLLGAEGAEGFGHVLALSDQPQTLAVLAWTALASTALTILLQTYALARVPAATASLVVSSEPLWAALLAAVLLGETNYGAADVAGGALILGASLAPAFLDDDAFAGDAADDDSE
mmetsp:Transcript_19315/g.50296  ORF Transcript_19315/g.50296 Transcript_19315/m.50296 type:complete len:418 (-) Transcript_19315:23-1276(-)